MIFKNHRNSALGVTAAKCPDVFLKHKLYSALLWKLHEALLVSYELVVKPPPSQALCSL